MSKPELRATQIYEFEIVKIKDTFGILNSYDLDIHVPGFARIFLGRFSSSVLPKIRILPRRDRECDVRIGAFCEAGDEVTLLAGGEHPNHSLFNFTFGASCEYFRVFMDEAGLARCIEPSQGLVIGDNVLMSQNVKIFDGAKVGSATVLAANAVVVSECEPNAFYGGVPAQHIKQRFPPDRLNDYERLRLPYIRAHCLAKLPTLIAKLDREECTIEDVLSEIEHMPRRPKISVSGGFNTEGVIGIGSILGFSIGENPITDETVIKKLLAYFKQFYEPGENIKWCPDIFHAMGLS